MNTLTHDHTDVERLDQHFADKRALELALSAEAQRTQQAAVLAQHTERMATLRNERVRRTGVAALLGGAGLGLALLGASFLIAPKEHERIVNIPGPEHVVTRDVPGPERIVKVPEYVTQKEKDFTERPEYKSAKLKGHLVADPDGLIRFDTGQTFQPLKPNPTTGLLEGDNGAMYDTTPYLGDLAYCNAIPGTETKTANHTSLFNCLAIHKDVIVDVDATYKQKPSPHAANDTSTRSAENMVNVNVDAGGYPIIAMVDTGCSYPMAIPQYLAEALTVNGHATRAGKTQTILADGSKAEVDVIMINQITVDGRTLHDVEAVVSRNTGASILLGLGALNRIGPYSIKDGQLVFTGEQPT